MNEVERERLKNALVEVIKYNFAVRSFRMNLRWLIDQANVNLARRHAMSEISDILSWSSVRDAVGGYNWVVAEVEGLIVQFVRLGDPIDYDGRHNVPETWAIKLKLRGLTKKVTSLPISPEPVSNVTE